MKKNSAVILVSLLLGCNSWNNCNENSSDNSTVISEGMELQKALNMLDQARIPVEEAPPRDVWTNENDGWVQYVVRPLYKSEDALILPARPTKESVLPRIESMYWHIKYDEDFALPKGLRTYDTRPVHAVDIRTLLAGSSISSVSNSLPNKSSD